jgi:hypothetical protein
MNQTRLVLILCATLTAFLLWSYSDWAATTPVPAPTPEPCPKCPKPLDCPTCQQCAKPQECPVCKTPEECPRPQVCPAAPPVEQCPLVHEPINFEPPQPNSLTGPRPAPLKKHLKSYARSSRRLYDASFALDPYVFIVYRLVTIPAGNAGKENVDKLVRKFGLENFQFILFHYDMSDWSNVTWYKDVISIRFVHFATFAAVRDFSGSLIPSFCRVTGRMKWWYMKRFITPQMAEMYEYVFAIDEDSDPETIDIPAFMNILRTHKIHIAQPAVTSGYSHQFTAVVKQYVRITPSER